MSVLGIDQITYGTDDQPLARRFFPDWGLTLVRESGDERVFEGLNGCRVVVAAMGKAGLSPAIEDGPTLREVVWGVETEADLNRYADAIRDDPDFTDGVVDGARRIGCTDPNGFAVRPVSTTTTTKTTESICLLPARPRASRIMLRPSRTAPSTAC